MKSMDWLKFLIIRVTILYTYIGKTVLHAPVACTVRNKPTL